MRHLLVLPLLLASSLPAQTNNVQVEAGGTSYDRASWSAGGFKEPLAPVRFSVTVPADEIVFSLSLQVTEPDEAKASAAVETLAESVRKALGNKGKLTATGPAALSPTFKGKVRTISSGIFGSSDTAAPVSTEAVAEFRLTTAVPAGQNPNTLGLEIKALLSGVKVPETARLHARGWMLRVSNPEAHRAQLLKQLSFALNEETIAVRNGTPLNLSGLDRVLVQEVASDREVRLTLPVSYSYGSQR